MGTITIPAVKLLHITLLTACIYKLKQLSGCNKVTLHQLQAILRAGKLLHMSTITEVMMNDKNLTTMLRSVKAAGMETILDATGPFTVFAPSEMAFGKLAQGTLTDLLKPVNKIKLNELLAHHIVNGATHFKDFTDGQQLKTLGGATLTVKITATATTINGATVQRRDAEASNGVLHSLDKVITGN